MVIELNSYIASFPFLCLCSIVNAQPAIYQDGVLSIPQGAVIAGDDPAYYTDIQLADDGAGNFQLLAAQPNNLVSIDSVDVLILESFPLQVQLRVSGNKSVPCVELLTPAVSRKDNVFTVVLAESTLGPEQSCIAVIDPFEIIISLDVLGLAAGTYVVRVNGVTAEFTFNADNVSQD